MNDFRLQKRTRLGRLVLGLACSTPFVACTADLTKLPRADKAAATRRPAPLTAVPPSAEEPPRRSERRAAAGETLAEHAAKGTVRPAENPRIEPGDLLEISVFELAEMNRRVRVASSGTIQLPLIGEVHVVGLSEAEVAKQIAGRLAKGYLENPQVDVVRAMPVH